MSDPCERYDILKCSGDSYYSSDDSCSSELSSSSEENVELHPALRLRADLMFEEIVDAFTETKKFYSSRVRQRLLEKFRNFITDLVTECP